ncbi:MAG: 2-isopropylmalate synthase [Alphaproteobacteria bacterium]
MSQENIIIFDTTLRDGEQSPGASMTFDEKIRIAKALEQLGVDVIEAGFPIASVGDFEAVHEIAKTVKNSTIAGLSRGLKGDIERCAEAIAPAERKRIHTFIATSPLHRKFKLNMEKEQVIEKIKESVGFARQFTDDVEWSAEDSARTEYDFLCQAVETAIKAGATTINLPDTVGYTTPEEYAAMIIHVRNNVPNIDKAIISVHCHNDLGLAVANSLSAVKAGARQVECTINGLGERAGNAALEEIVMAIKTRKDVLPFKTNIDTTKIMKVSRLVSQATGFVVQPNKAIVGDNAFAHESGIHQDGMLKNAETYEIMTPESVGIAQTNLVLGKHSGSHAFRKRLEELGYELGDNALKDAFRRFKALADQKKDIYDDDLIALVDDEAAAASNHIKLVSVDFHCGTNFSPAEASVTLEIDGVPHSAMAQGDGPIDAAFTCVKQLCPIRPHLNLYQIDAVTGGTDALGYATVRLEYRGSQAMGQAADTDVMVSSVKAYINAVNSLLNRLEKAQPHGV